jgi:hypothetical protein
MKTDLSAYRRVRAQGIELLVSKVLFTQAALVQIERQSFLWSKWLAVRAKLQGHHT